MEETINKHLFSEKMLEPGTYIIKNDVVYMVTEIYDEYSETINGASKNHCIYLKVCH